MTNQDSGNVPQKRRKTIDSNGNIIDKPYGAGRWHSSRTRGCAHDDCTNSATILKHSPSIRAHNCCTKHKEGDSA